MSMYFTDWKAQSQTFIFPGCVDLIPLPRLVLPRSATWPQGKQNTESDLERKTLHQREEDVLNVLNESLEGSQLSAGKQGIGRGHS